MLTKDLPCKTVTNSAWSLGEHAYCVVSWFKLLAIFPMRKDLSWVWEPLISSLCVEIKSKFVKNEEWVALKSEILSIYQKAIVQHQGKPEGRYSVEGPLAWEVTTLKVEQICICTANTYLSDTFLCSLHMLGIQCHSNSPLANAILKQCRTKKNVFPI